MQSSVEKSLEVKESAGSIMSCEKKELKKK